MAGLYTSMFVAGQNYKLGQQAADFFTDLVREKIMSMPSYQKEALLILKSQEAVFTTFPTLSKLTGVKLLKDGKYYSIQARDVNDACIEIFRIIECNSFRSTPVQVLPRVGPISKKPEVSSRSVPNEFKCPISFEIMEDPVITKCSHTFDRASIITWLSRNPLCPICRNRIEISDLVPNRSLKSLIQGYNNS